MKILSSTKAAILLLLLTAPLWVIGQPVSLTDIQYTLTGTSSYDGQVVQTTGVVTSSIEADNLGYVNIQEEGVVEWGGIGLYGNADLLNLKIGDRVSVEGTVGESFGLTYLGQITSVVVLDSNVAIQPVELDPAVFSSGSFLELQKYESLYVRLVNGSDSVYVVDADVGFGDYRIGTDIWASDVGCQVLAGRQNSNTYSSLNVSYVSDLFYFDNDGQMNVPAIEVENGDAFPWVQGIVTYGFSDYRLLPRNNADFGSMSTGINEFQHRDLKVYPNPSTGIFNLDLSTINGSGVLEVFAISGRRILSKQVTTADRTIDLTGFAEGVYMLRITSSDAVYGQRLIVQ